MNIFILDVDLDKNVKYHVDKHVVKMRVELAQLASSAHHMTKSTFEPPYKLTHPNHPCAIWTRESLFNYNYVVDLGLALCEEMRHRFNTKNQIAEEKLLILKENPPLLPNTLMTCPKLGMSEKYYPPPIMMVSNEERFQFAVDNYREYYRREKQHIYKWSKREKPDWL